MSRLLVLVLATLIVAAVPPPRGGPRSSERYASFAVDSAGRLSITTADHRTIVARLDADATR